MAVGDPAPTTCSSCGAVSVYEHMMRADGRWVVERICTVCQKVQS